MDRLEQIKNAVTANGMREWTDERVNQVALEYTTEVARHNLERAASEARVIHTGTEKTSWQINDIIVDKQSITSLDIELI